MWANAIPKFVLDYLATERIPVVSQDVLDIHPRKVCFFPVTGKALVKRLAHSHPRPWRLKSVAATPSRWRNQPLVALLICFEGQLVKKIRVVVVDDSALVRSLLAEIINRQPDMECVGRGQ